MFDLPPSPLLIVISGPSGVGKDAVLDRMKQAGYPFTFVTTVTTRAKRAQEKDGLDYHFVSDEVFRRMIDGEELLEWANVYGCWYGVPRQPVKQALADGRDVVLKVDVQGVANIKKILPEAVFIFLVPPSMVELSARLEQRCSESPANLALRSKTAGDELKRLPLFDYVVVNRRGEIDRALAQIEAIITAEKCRVKPREITL